MNFLVGRTGFARHNGGWINRVPAWISRKSLKRSGYSQQEND